MLHERLHAEILRRLGHYGRLLAVNFLSDLQLVLENGIGFCKLLKPHCDSAKFAEGGSQTAVVGLKSFADIHGFLVVLQCIIELSAPEGTEPACMAASNFSVRPGAAREAAICDSN